MLYCLAAPVRDEEDRSGTSPARFVGLAAVGQLGVGRDGAQVRASGGRPPGRWRLCGACCLAQ